MKTNKQILQEAKQLLIDKGWTKGCFARDADGEEVSAYSYNATCFCTFGAIKRVAFDNDGFAGDCFAIMNESVLSAFDIPEFNDAPSTTKEMVLELFDKAIVKA